ncbi:AIPR family protein [Rhizobium sp. NZLR8]|uniref:AIPR family protein n=1 Tax=Rhizobium sp. NZLR8 TaxID=2731104 RepID=UPI001C83E3D3|nr:AIPR family protein [Rhizobium sp. NZLR8]MBX5160410.1 AIPR family protein [Rhizobium sp. NZLR8]
MSELEDFHRQIIADVQGDADALGRVNAVAFFEITGEYLTEAGEIDSASWSYFEGKASSSTLQVHGYGGDPRDAEGILSLIICDFEITPEPRTVNSDHVKRLFKRLVDFLTQARKASFRSGLEESSSGFGLADLISATWSEVDKIKLILVTNAEFRAKSDAVPAGLIDQKPVTYSVWDLKRLARYVEQGVTRQSSEVDFVKDFGGPVPVLRASSGEAALETYIAVMPGHQLASIYDRWGPRLLESNVRSFLQARGAVNRGIRDTIVKKPEMFLAYNNGLSATADSVEIEETPRGLVLTRAENLQIVNGGQTTASIHAARKAAPEQLNQVFVQMKLSIVPQEMSEEVVPLISQFANSQNKVAAADFFANHPFHIRIEGFSRRLLVPAGSDGYRETKWFYERARGQFADERGRRTISERKIFDSEYPRSQFFSKTDLAKYENTWSELPHEVSKGAQKNFTEFAKAIGTRWGKDGTSFDEVWFRRLVAKTIIFRRTENLVSSALWYQGGYRANIVTYAIAKLVHDAGKLGRQINLDAVWRQQGTSELLDRVLQIAAEDAQSIILSPPSGIRNFSEWAKKQGCWKALADRKLEYPENLEDLLVAPDEAAAEVREARADKALSVSVSAEVKVHQLGAAFWAQVAAWARQNKRLSPTDTGILETCAAIPRKMPSDRQCKFALSILEKLVAGGFRHPAIVERPLEKV